MKIINKKDSVNVRFKINGVGFNQTHDIIMKKKMFIATSDSANVYFLQKYGQEK